MKLVRTVPVSESNLDSTDVVDTQAAWSNVTTYGAAAECYEVISDLAVLEALDLDPVPGLRQAFRSKAGGNINHQPSLDVSATYWEALGPTNSHLMFDATLESQTERTSAITVAIQLDADERIDHVRVANIAAGFLQVTFEDPIDGVVYDETFDLTDPAGINDPWAYTTEPIARLRGKTVVMPTGLYAGGLVTIALTDAGETVKCGLCLVGLSRELGGTRWGAGLGFRDFSVKSENSFGGTRITRRAFKRTGKFAVIVQAGFVDRLQTLLEDYRAEAVLFIGDDAYDTMAIYGFVKSFEEVVAYPTQSECALELESLA